MMRIVMNAMDRWVGWPRRFLIRRNDGQPYIERWTFLDHPALTVKLQRIMASDGQHPHCHPWNFWSIILVGAYTEELFPRGPALPPTIVQSGWLSTRRRDSHLCHRVTIRRTTWTLLIGGRRHRVWGFHIPEKELPRLMGNERWRVKAGHNIEACLIHAGCAFVPWQFYIDVPFCPAGVP